MSSNGVIDNSVDGRGKGEWTSDNQQTAAPFFLVYNPGGRPQLLGGTPAASNVNLLAETIVLNYLALHGQQGSLASVLGSTGLPSNLWDSLTAFTPIVNGTITNPV